MTNAYASLDNNELLTTVNSTLYLLPNISSYMLVLHSYPKNFRNDKLTN